MASIPAHLLHSFTKIPFRIHFIIPLRCVPQLLIILYHITVTCLRTCCWWRPLALCGVTPMWTSTWRGTTETSSAETTTPADKLLSRERWVKGCSHGAIATAIYLSKLMGYMEFNVVVTITPCEPLHWVPYSPFIAIERRSRSCTM